MEKAKFISDLCTEFVKRGAPIAVASSNATCIADLIPVSNMSNNRALRLDLLKIMDAIGVVTDKVNNTISEEEKPQKILDRKKLLNLI